MKRVRGVCFSGKLEDFRASTKEAILPEGPLGSTPADNAIPTPASLLKLPVKMVYITVSVTSRLRTSRLKDGRNLEISEHQRFNLPQN